MEYGIESPRSIQFEDFELDVRAGELRKAGWLISRATESTTTLGAQVSILRPGIAWTLPIMGYSRQTPMATATDSPAQVVGFQSRSRHISANLGLRVHCADNVPTEYGYKRVLQQAEEIRRSQQTATRQTPMERQARHLPHLRLLRLLWDHSA